MTSTPGVDQQLDDYAEIERQLAELGELVSFPWHAQQEAALRACTDIIAVVGGNRSGKSQVGGGMVSRVARREGPIYRRFRNPVGRKLRLWIAPQTDEKAKSLWEPLIKRMLEGLDFSYVQTPHRVFTWHDDQGGGEIWLKTQEQGFMAFESDDVDLVLFDEEPEDRRVYNSAKIRLSTTNGVVILTYTPLNGMTWTYDEIYEPVAKHKEFEIGDRVWRRGNEITVIQMGMADNPAAVEGGGVARIQADVSMSPAEKNARLYGDYGFTEGLLFPMWADLNLDRTSPYVLESLPKDRPYHWYLTADPNKRHGALLVALDHEGNRYYCAEHYAIGIPDSQHAIGYDAMLKQFNLRRADLALIASDPGGAGAQAIINLAESGYDAIAVPKDPGSVAASIKRLRGDAFPVPGHKHPVTGAEPSPKVYFLRSLRSTWRTGDNVHHESRLVWELRQYRQKPDAAPDTPIKRNDDVVDCARYFELIRAAEPQLAEFDPDKAARAQLDDASRQEQDAFDRLAKRAAAQYAARTRAR